MIEVGTIIERKYRVIELVGTGGMAHVYKAINMSNQRIVALKMLKDEYLNDAEFLRRFSIEASAVLNLSHENIVRAYGVGSYGDIPYIVMEFVEGHTLKELIEQNGALPVRTAIGITCQILDALNAAHTHGIIHRDVKPQNIIVTAKGKAKLADFGIARETKAATITFSGKKVLGSVHYISPEQAKGALANEASDLYSIGVCLYEMLTGVVPFASESTVSVALMHLQDKPIPPIERNPAIPPSLNDIVLKALEKDPAERYDSAFAMRTDLVRSLSNPNGDFVHAKKNPKISANMKKPSAYLLLSACIFLPVLLIGVFVLMYFINSGKTTNTPPDQTDLSNTTSVVATSEAASATAVPLDARITPSVMGKSLDDALSTLYDAGYSNLTVQFITESTVASKANTVISQNPLSMTLSSAQDTVNLVVYRESVGTYKADVSFSLSLERGESRVQFVYETSNYLNIPYRVILHQVTRHSENGEAIESATVYGYEPVKRNIILVINGEDVDTQEVTFSK